MDELEKITNVFIVTRKLSSDEDFKIKKKKSLFKELVKIEQSQQVIFIFYKKFLMRKSIGLKILFISLNISSVNKNLFNFLLINNKIKYPIVMTKKNYYYFYLTLKFKNQDQCLEFMKEYLL